MRSIGLVGVALGTAIPHIIVVGWILPRQLPKIVPVNLRAYYREVYGRTLLASVPFVVACWLVATVVQPASLASFFFWGILSLPAYIVPAWLIALTDEERALALRVITRRGGPGPERPPDADLTGTSSDHRAARRILYVEGNEDGTIGGSYLSLLFLVSGLDRTRFDPLVVFARENTLIPRFHERHVRTMVRPPARAVRWRGRGGRLCGKAVNFAKLSLWQPVCLALLLRREQVGLVHLNNTVRRNHPWMIAAWLARVPCITHERGINEEFSRTDHVLAPRLGAVICISKAVEDNFVARGLGNLNLLTIHNGLDPAEMRVTRDPNELRAELGIPRGARVIGLVGNIKPWKGQELVIQAMDQLRDEFPDVVCLLIGATSDDATDYQRDIEQSIDRRGLNRRVLMTGFRSDVANYVNLLDIQVHASVAPEPFGRVLLEAMALCKPLVASNAGGVPEIVIDGTTGLLFEPKNVDALVGCLRQLLRDPARARMLGQAARRRLETDFSVTSNATRTQAAVQHVTRALARAEETSVRSDRSRHDASLDQHWPAPAASVVNSGVLDQASRRRIKVMLAIDGLGLGGAEMVVRDLARFLDRSGSTSASAAREGWEAPSARSWSRDGFDVFVLPGRPDWTGGLPDGAEVPARRQGQSASTSCTRTRWRLFWMPARAG